MSGDLHLSLTVLRDNGYAQLPTTYLRDRLVFSGPEEAERYHERLLAWIALRPAPGEPGGHPRTAPEQLGEILDRAGVPEPLRHVFDWAVDG